MVVASSLGARGVRRRARLRARPRSRSRASSARSSSASGPPPRASASRCRSRARARCAANPRLYGGLVVHVGVVSIAVALAASSGYATKREVAARARASRRPCAGYTRHVPRAAISSSSDQKTTVTADVRVERGGDEPRHVRARDLDVPEHGSGIGTPSVRTGLVADVYLTLVSSPTPSGRRHARRAGRTRWCCGSGSAALLMALGTVIALAPGASGRRLLDGRASTTSAPVDRRRSSRRRREARARALDRASRSVLVVVVLGVVLALQRRQRPAGRRRYRVRSTAGPTFTLTTLDGETVDAGRPRGQDRHRELLEHVVHPVPHEAPGAARVLRTAQRRPRLRDGRHRARRHRDGRARATSTEDGIDWTIAIDPEAAASLEFGAPASPRRSRSAPTGASSCEQRLEVQLEDLELMLAAARGSVVMRRWLPWLALAAVVLVDARRARGAVAAVGVRRRPGARRLERELRLSGVRGRVGGRQQRTRRRGRSASTSASAWPRASPTPRSVAVYVARYGENVALKPGDDGIGAARAGGSRSSLVLGAGGVGLVIALRRWSREPRLDGDAPKTRRSSARRA